MERSKSKSYHPKNNFLTAVFYIALMSIVIVAILFLFFYQAFSNFAKEQTMDASRSITERICYSISEMNDSIRNLCITQFYDSDVQYLMHAEKLDSIEVQQTIARLKRSAASNLDIQSIITYNYKTGRTISTVRGITDIDEPIKQILQQDEIPYLTPIPRELTQTDYYTSGLVFSYVIYDTYQAGDINCAMIVNINDDWLTESLKKQTESQENLIVFDDQFRQIASTVNDIHNLSQSVPNYAAELLGTSGIIEATDGEKYFISVSAITGTNWYLLRQVPFSVMLSKFHTLEKKLLLFTTGILILALAISVFVVRGIYRPIRKIASLLQLQNYAPEIPAPRMDALNYISQTLEQVDHQYRHIQETAQLLVQRNLLRSMLLGVTPSGLDEQSVQHARTAILDALSPYYMVLLRMDHAASYTKLSQEQRRLLVECLSAAGLLNVKTGAYDKEILRLYGLEDAWEKLPPLHGSAEILGRVTESFSARTGLPAGTPVLGGLFDVNSCMLGAGVIQTNRFSMTAGTWGINAIPAAAPVVAKNITQCCQFYGEVPYVCIDSAPTSCANLEWYAKKMMHTDDFPALSQMVQERPSEPELFFLPYLYAPMDLPQLSGGFVGLKPHHDQIDLLRAVFEGIVFEHRRRMEKLQSNGLDAESLVLSGGASGSPVFAQLFADICNKEVLIPQQSQAGAMGGVLLSQMAAGVYASLSDAVASLVRYKQSCIPIYASNYEQKYQRFCDLIRKR